MVSDDDLAVDFFSECDVIQEFNVWPKDLFLHGLAELLPSKCALDKLLDKCCLHVTILQRKSLNHSRPFFVLPASLNYMGSLSLKFK